MQQVLGLKATGTVLVRFTNSPITRSKEAIVGAYHEFGLIVGFLMQKICVLSASIFEETSVSTEWSKCELEALVAKGIVQYRAAAATARRAYNRWRPFMGTAAEGEYSIRLEEYRVARAICGAHRAALSHLIDQLGYVPSVAASPSPLNAESQ